MIIEKFKQTIKKYKLLQNNDKVLIGVSGGADSLALLFLLNTIKPELNLNLYIAHLDHKIRKDSYKDREFVERIAKRLKLKFFSKIIDLKSLLYKRSLEETAREVRLNFLFNTAKSLGIKKIALGHNQDDQVETVLMRLIRGAGLYGLQGILPKRDIRGFTIIRPLIKLRRREIENYLKRKKIKPRKDITNFQDIYFRNKIRNKLLPLLEKEYNSNIREILLNLAENAGIDYDFIEKKAERIFKKITKKTKISEIIINLEKLLRNHLAIQRLVIRLAIRELKGDLRRITFKHLKEIEDLILNRPAGSVVNLPAKISIQKKNKFLRLYLL